MIAGTVLTEEELSQAFADRDPDALDQAYRRYIDVLFGVARSIVDEPAEAQDCVHDAMLRVWHAPYAYRPERGLLRSFLIVCVRNEALSRRRAAARHRALERREMQLAPDADAHVEPEDHIAKARVREALATLPQGQRSVLELAYFGMRTHAEIAARLGIPVGTVKSRASLALRKLALVLGPPSP